MLKISGLVKTKPFQFTDLDGKEHALEISEFTIADMKKLIDIQEPIEIENNIATAAQCKMLVASRVVCAVKVQGGGGYFWDTIDDLMNKDYPNDLTNTLHSLVTELNTIDTPDEDVDEKKSES